MRNRDEYARRGLPAITVAQGYHLEISEMHKAFPAGSVVYVTVGDASYEETLMNHFAHFRNHGLHNQLMVACLDAACQEQCLNASIYHVTGLPQNVPETKLRVILEVLVAHYQLLFFDADVFFLKHPLTGIGLVENIDMEFQTDSRYVDHDGDSAEGYLNFGYFFANPTNQSLQFWQDVLEIWMITSGGVDQGIVNELYHNKEYMQHWDIKVKVDTHELFRNVMFDDVKQLTSDYQASQIYAAKAVLLHMTCLGPGASMKSWVAKVLGAWVDTDGYYSSFPSLVRVVTVPSLEVNMLADSQMSNDIVCIMQIMRSLPSWVFMPPAVVTIMGQDSLSSKLPFHWVYRISDLGMHLEFVEPFYLHHWHKWQAHGSNLSDNQLMLPHPKPLPIQAGSSVEDIVSSILVQNDDFVELIDVSNLSCKSSLDLTTIVCANKEDAERGCLQQCL